jgi:hypothetical protein
MTALPPKIHAALLAGLRTTHALSETSRWLELRDVDALVLQGDTGSGKSVAAGWAYQFVSRRCRPSAVGMQSFPVWYDASRAASLRPWDEAWKAIDSAPLVVIDDVGTEEKATAMTAVLEHCWNVSAGRVVITTNLDPETFFGRYGDRVRSRVVGTGAWVECADVDMRSHPPTSVPFKRPEEETASELVARMAAEDAKRREQDEHEAQAPERERWLARHMDDLRKRLSADKFKSPDLEDEARVRIRRVIEQEAQHTKAAWED